MSYGFIYLTKNIINNKIYIGQKIIRDNKCITYLGSGIIIKSEIKKYGKENFIRDILEFCNSKEQLNSREVYWISKYNSTDSNIGYNISKGSCGGDLVTPEKRYITNKKISKSLRLYWNTNRDEKSKESSNRMKLLHKTNPNMSKNNRNKTGKNHPMYGVISSAETRRLISENNKKYYQENPNKKIEMSIKIKSIYNENPTPWIEAGKKRTGDNNHMRKKEKFLISGKNNNNYGNKWTDEQKSYMSNKMKNKYDGHKNPNSKKVIRIEDGKIYNTISECYNDNNMTYSQLHTAINKNKMYNGYTFKKI